MWYKQLHRVVIVPTSRAGCGVLGVRLRASWASSRFSHHSPREGVPLTIHSLQLRKWKTLTCCRGKAGIHTLRV